jgi:cystathionine gamma-synthase
MPPEPVNPPIVASSNFRFADTVELERALRRDGHMYSRWGNPTVEVVEASVSKLCGAEATLAFGSGMAAVASALLAGLAERKRLYLQAQVYGATYELAVKLLRDWGKEVVLFEIDAWRDVVKDEAGVVYIETPNNPTLRCVDIAALAQAAKRCGALLFVDNTFATPINQRPLALGADVELHSATKYFGGHHDLLAGTVSGSKAFCERLWTYRKLLGGILDPFPAYLVFRGLETLELRVARQNETALRLAAWLEEHPRVVRVFHPGLTSHPDHALAKRQMTGFGGMLAVEVQGGRDGAVKVVDGLSKIALAASLGGTGSLACMPLNTSHAGVPPDERRRLGIGDGLIRVSVGVEPYEVLRDDLERALEV